jgi:hypothetical protein
MRRDSPNCRDLYQSSTINAKGEEEARQELNNVALMISNQAAFTIYKFGPTAENL